MTQKKSTRKRINWLFTAVEADPFVKVGGLGDVAYALPHALRNLHPNEVDGNDIDIRLAIPCHSSVCQSVEEILDKITFEVDTNLGKVTTTVYVTEINGLPIYIISSPLIPQNDTVYSTDTYADGLKFLFFSQATLGLVNKLNWDLDVIHVNDWHTAITPYLMNVKNNNRRKAAKARSILTIHNLPFMGSGAENAIEDLGIPYSHDKHLPGWARKLPLPIGIASSDHIIAVSPTYAEEILTPEFGCGLEDYLGTRKSALSGIINGLDTHQWDPATDMEILARYSIDTLYERSNNKHVLQNELNLPIDPDIPLLAFIGRLTHQKGIDLIIDALRLCRTCSWQAIILGKGDINLEKQAIQLEAEFPDRVRTIVQYDSRLSRRIYAGSDILMMPSRYEPCGLAQMIAMRYGCIPLARATGGLKDTITDISDPLNATGYLFSREKAREMADTLQNAFEDFKSKPKWHVLQTNAMRKDFSWHRSALKYADLLLKK